MPLIGDRLRRRPDEEAMAYRFRERIYPRLAEKNLIDIWVKDASWMHQEIFLL